MPVSEGPCGVREGLSRPVAQSEPSELCLLLPSGHEFVALCVPSRPSVGVPGCGLAQLRKRSSVSPFLPGTLDGAVVSDLLAFLWALCPDRHEVLARVVHEPIPGGEVPALSLLPVTVLVPQKPET